MSSLVNKVFHYVNIGSFNCHMEGSHLMKRKVEKNRGLWTSCIRTYVYRGEGAHAHTKLETDFLTKDDRADIWCT